MASVVCKEEDSREIIMEIFQSSKTGKHKNMGFSSFNLKELREGKTDFPLKKKESVIGIVKFKELKIKKRNSFLNYIFGGCEVSLMLAVDFTLSNGPPNEPNSLHYFDTKKNEYLAAIQSVGSILQYYDQDKQIPFFGFGGKIAPIANRASHCFAVNGNIFDPECDGIDGVIDAYKHALSNI